jgi:apolipoprotein D and lipocalin family protein
MVLALGGCSASQPPLPTVERVDLQRYQGTWHELARLPQWFQRGCVRSSAEYTVIDAGTVGVVNRCVTGSGEQRMASGRATVLDATTNARLQVVFDNWFSRVFPGVATGEYWVVDLDPDYRTVIVGHPSRDYLWILSRTPELPEDRYQALVQRAAGLGFDTSRLIRAGQP